MATETTLDGAAIIPPKVLAAKIVKIIAEVGGVPKSARNEHMKYNYRDEEGLLAHLRPLMVKYGIIYFPNVIDVQVCDTTTTVRMRFDLIDSESGDMWSCLAAGQGIDAVAAKSGKLGDKGIYSAQTGALKYFLQKLFQIGSKDDPERDGETGLAKRAPNASQGRRNEPQRRNEPAPQKRDARDNIQKSADHVAEINAEKAVDSEKAAPSARFTSLDELVTKLNAVAERDGTHMAETADEMKFRHETNKAVNKFVGDKNRIPLLGLLFGKSMIFSLTVGECQAISKWINLGPDGVPCAEAVAEYEFLRPHMSKDA